MEIIAGAFLLFVAYVLPCVVTMCYSIQTHSQFWSEFAFIPVLNIVAAFMCIGNLVYNFFV